jgi:hypothetical protein
MARTECSIKELSSEFDLIKLDDSNRSNFHLIVLLGQLFIELYFFNIKKSNLSDYDLVLRYVEPIYVNNNQMTNDNQMSDVDKTYVYDDPKKTILNQFLNYNPDTSINDPMINKNFIESIINIICYYLKAFTVPLLSILNNIIIKIKEQIFACSNYYDVKQSTISQFNDSRIFSISVLLNYLIIRNDYSNHHIIILNNKDITRIDSYIKHAHVFIINNGLTIEAISIQTSIILLNDNICKKVSCKIAERMFDYILKSNPYKDARYIYACTWPILSKIIVDKFNFIQVIRDDSDNITLKYKPGNPKTLSELSLPLFILTYAHPNYIMTFRELDFYEL